MLQSGSFFYARRPGLCCHSAFLGTLHLTGCGFSPVGINLMRALPGFNAQGLRAGERLASQVAGLEDTVYTGLSVYGVFSFGNDSTFIVPPWPHKLC